MRWDVHVRLVHSFVPLLRLLRHASFVLLALAALTSACDEADLLGGTQVTARIYVDGEVRSALSELRVRSYRSTGGRFLPRADRRYAKDKLADVLDVSFVPLDGEGDGTVLVVADALSSAGEVLVEARATFAFVAGEQRLFELWLYRCGSAPLGELCAAPDCADQTCLTCVRDRCGATPLYTKPQLTVFDPAIAVDPNKLPPGHRAAEADAPNARDAGSAPDASAVDTPDEPNELETSDAGIDAACQGASCNPVSGDAGSADAAAVGEEASTLDATTEDARAIDAGDGASRDAAVDASDAAPEPPGRCAQDTAWTTIGQANATIPAQARQLAQHTNSSGALPQYLCRMRAPDGVVLAPGKVSALPATPTRFDHGCYATYYGPVSGRPGTQAWQSFASDTLDIDFQVLTPPSDCQLEWVAMNAGQALPARALAVGTSGGATPEPIYACRVTVTDSSTTGTHIGRVGGDLGEPCHVQYYQQAPLERTQFEILIQK